MLSDREQRVRYVFKNTLKFPYALIDLTHTLDENAPGWNESCSFRMSVAIDYGDCSTDVKFRAHRIATTAGMGTHMDAPVHCSPGGATIDVLPLESLIVPCVVIDVSAQADQEYRVSVADIEAFEKTHGTISEGALVIIRTSWDRYWSDPERYRNNYQFPSITVEVARFLLTRGMIGLGVDTFSADRPVDEFRVHEAVLGAGKYLVENIAKSDQLPPVGAFVGIFPLKLKDGSESPIRLVGFMSK